MFSYYVLTELDNEETEEQKHLVKRGRDIKFPFFIHRTCTCPVYYTGIQSNEQELHISSTLPGTLYQNEKVRENSV